MKNVLFALQALPHILAGVQAVEAAMHGAPGTEKKQMIMNAITGAAKAGEDIPNDKVQLFSELIDKTVTTLNASGIFTHAATK